MTEIVGEKIDVATATALITLPIIPITRQPYLLQRAEANGAVFK